MAPHDSFVELARYYDPLMGNVDYDRWYLVTGLLAELLERPFKHLDVACGTGVLLKKLRADRWRSFGVDLSVPMLRAGRTGTGPWPVTAGDLRALPFRESFDYITCLFDSVNFLLQNPDMEAGIRSMSDALVPDGLLYFDIVTERMVLDHFAGQTWTEKNGKFSTTWDCEYNRKTRVAETRIKINKGTVYTLYERIYELEEITLALGKAGIEVLSALDAENWRAPRRKSVRIDIIGVKGTVKPLKGRFKDTQKQVQRLLR